MKAVHFRTTPKATKRKASHIKEDILDAMATKWARRAEFYKKKKYKQLQRASI